MDFEILSNAMGKLKDMFGGGFAGGNQRTTFKFLTCIRLKK